MKIDEMSYREETGQLELKRSLAQKREGLESLNGMLNSDRGTGKVIFGIDPAGEVVGIESGNLDKVQLSLVQHIRQKFEPRAVVDITVEASSGKNLLVLQGQRPQDVPYFEYDGRAFIREGPSTRQLSLSEKATLVRRRTRDQHTGPWRCDRCGSIAGTLSQIEVSDRGVKRTWGHDCGGEWWPAT